MRPTTKMMIDAMMLKTSFCTDGAAFSISFSNALGLMADVSMEDASMGSTHPCSNNKFIEAFPF